MKTKYINNVIILALLAIFFWSCEKEYLAPTGEPSHEYVTTSYGPRTILMQVNSSMEFVDLSRGVVDRTWNFPETAVLEDGSGLLTSKEQTVIATFVEPGVFNVVLSQKYADQVTVDSVLTDKDTYDTTFVVTVWDYVQADFEARTVLDPYTFINQDGAKNQVMAGREVVFASRSVGPPETYTWIFTRDDGYEKIIDGEADSIVNVFSGLGVYTVKLVAKNRFSGDTIVFNDYVEAIPSTDPMVLFSTSAKNGKVEMEWSRDIADPSSCPLNAFTVNIRNGADSVPVGLTSLSLDPVQNNILVLNLDGDIYNSDLIKVSYDSTIGNLQSADNMALPSVVDQHAIFSVTNILLNTEYDHSFELYDNKYWRSPGWGAGFSASYMNTSSAMAYDGKKSAYFNMPADSGSATVLFNAPEPDYTINRFALQGGTAYTISAWIYVESVEPYIDELEIPDIRFYLNVEGGSAIETLVATFDEFFAVGKWVYVSKKYVPNASDDYEIIYRGWNPITTGPLQVYVDAVSISILEERP